MEIGAMEVLMLIGIAFAIAVAIAWIVLPFAIIGTKPILTALLDEARKANRMQEELLAIAKDTANAQDIARQAAEPPVLNDEVR